MSNLADLKYVGPEFKKSAEIVRVVWDFAVEGGAQADINLLSASGACIVKLKHAHVKTAVTSGGSLVMDLGKNAGGTEFWSNLAKASLTLNAVKTVDAVAGLAGILLAENDTVVLGIEVADATAGKIEFVFEVMAV